MTTTKSLTATVEGHADVPVAVTIEGDVVDVVSVALRYGTSEGARVLVADVQIVPVGWFAGDPRPLRSHLLVAVQTPGFLARAMDGSDRASIDIFDEPWDVLFGTAGVGAPQSVRVELEVEPLPA
ncbi:MAG: hypothetical protein K0S70_2578 [Microbacterium sp.]|jgi:hypothetical protein|nr:hypothetical protein [Microbacterium sp.]